MADVIAQMTEDVWALAAVGFCLRLRNTRAGEERAQQPRG